MRHFTVSAEEFGKALLPGKHWTLHFFKITDRIAIIWDRKDGK
jgi:hypothetical protein